MSATPNHPQSNQAAAAGRFRKRLVVCCDGTWNDSVSTESPLTNVSRFSRCVKDVADDGIPQVVSYHIGVGSGTSWVTNKVDGATGRGTRFLSRKSVRRL